MYEQHFDLTERPFRLQPDPDFLYWSAEHRAAADFLAAAAAGPGDPAKPVHVLTGEVGGGKTTLILNLLAAPPQGVRIGLVSNLAPDCRDALPWLARSLPGAVLAADPLAQIIAQVREVAATGCRVVFIIDEAQNLAPEGFETLQRLLSAADMAPALILAGQPELATHLADRRNAGFAALIAGRANLSRLPDADGGAYIRHRFAVAAGAPEMFSDDALRLIHRAAKGIPRLVNLIADQALFTAFSAGRDRVDAGLVRDAIANSTAPMLRHLVLPVVGETPAPPAKTEPPLLLSPGQRCNVVQPKAEVAREQVMRRVADRVAARQALAVKAATSAPVVAKPQTRARWPVVALLLIAGAGGVLWWAGLLP